MDKTLPIKKEIKKLLPIDSCFDCKFCNKYRYSYKRFRGQVYCNNLKKYLGLKFLDMRSHFKKPGIYKDCPLENYREG